MKTNKIDHIAIAVKNLDESIKVFNELTGKVPDKLEVVEEQKANIALYDIGGSHIELLGGTADDSPITKYLEKKGEGLHHICFKVENIEAKLEELEQKGFRLIDKTPRIGAMGKKIAFLHPASANGVLIELCE